MLFFWTFYSSNNLERKKVLSLILRNVSWAANQHIIMISEGSIDTEVWSNGVIQDLADLRPLNGIMDILNSCLNLQKAKGCQTFLTLCNHTLQSDDVRIIKLSHDARLSQEIPSLTLSVSPLQSLYSHRNFLFSWDTEPATAHLPKLAYRIHSSPYSLSWHLGLLLTFVYTTH